MAAMSDYLEQKLLDEVFNGVGFTSPATYIALFTAAPSDSGGGTEVTGGSYARKQVNVNGGSSPTWNLAVTEGGGGYLVDNLHDITFVTASADWGSITHFGIFDALTTGNLLVHGALTAPKTVQNGDTFKFAVGDLDVIFR